MKVELRYRYKGGKLGKPIQIGKRTQFEPQEAETIRKSLLYSTAIALIPVGE